MNGPVATPDDSAISATPFLPPQKRKTLHAVVAGHVVAPVLRRSVCHLPQVDVVIAGNDGDVLGAADGSEPVAGALILDRQRQIDEVAGDGDVVGRLRFQVARDLIENFAAMDMFALAVPIDEAEPALADELRQPRLQRHMQIGDMGENEHRCAGSR